MKGERRGRQWLLAAGIMGVSAVVALWWSAAGQRRNPRESALIAAARSGDVKAVETALDGGADANCRDADGITPLMHAARGDRPDIANSVPSDHPEVVELLIKRGADVNARTGTGFVALFWAARYGHAGVAKVLIAHGADVNAKDKDGMTALRWATTNQQARVVELLKEAGAKG